MRGLLLVAAIISAVPVFAAPIPVPGASTTPQLAAGEALCGPEIVLLGDAWEHVRLERDGLQALLKSGDLVRVPQKTSALASHLTFMKNRSLMVFGDAKEKLEKNIGALLEDIPRWNALALTGAADELTTALPRLDARLAEIGAQYPDEALITSSASSFLLPPVVPSLQVKIAEPPKLVPGEEATVRFRLIAPNGDGVRPEDLHTTHTVKLHALMLDPLFQDYHHTHPEPTDRPDEFVFRFTPRLPSPYRLWLDAMPVATGRGEFPIADLVKIPRPIRKAPAPSAPIVKANADGWNCELTVPGDDLVFGQPSVVTLTITDRNGGPVTHLQPLMGAFAHVVGFADDFQTILHIHPIGAVPKAEDFGGPKIDFQLRPTLPGWLRLYVQFSIEERVHLATFAVRVVVR